MATVNNAAADEDIEYDLREDFPEGWQPSSAYSVELSYECVDGEMQVSYKETLFSAAAFVRDLGSTIRNAAFMEAISAATTATEVTVLDGKLDLKVRQHCMIIIRLDEDQEIYWGNEQQPVRTKGVERPDLYFGLRMIDANGDAYKPREFPPGHVCKQISFGARCLPPGTPQQSHRFAIHLWGPNCRTGEPGPIDIDPDIKNPSL